MLTTPLETLGETSSILYDYEKARPIQTITNNYLDGYTKVQSLYNFAGQVLQTVTQHKRLVSSSIITVTEDYDYSPQGRLINHFHTIGAVQKQLLSHNDYNELGQLITKNVGGQDITTFHGLQKVDYQYNIRGWLTNINDITNLTEGTNPTDMFAFKINYNNPENEVGENTASLYNGNIAQTYWRTSSDNIVRKYGYTYDSLNRLNNAMYIKPNETVPITNSYNESLSYDKNGNIMALQRTGSLDSNSGITVDIDNLTYNYANSNQSNQLMKVTDATNNPNGFKDDSDGTNDTNDDYGYDLNGNMTSDENKGITIITYNHLNLPTQINFGTLGNITYIYNAVGQKLKKVVLDNTTTTTTDYLDGNQYKNGLLQFFPTAEGYVNCNAPKLIAEVVEGVERQVLVANPTPVFSYVYNYTDHLGNIRLSYSQDPVTNALRVIEENHYYPFGLKHNNYNSDTKMYVKENEILKVKPVPPLFKTSYNIKYQGQRREEDLGLNWDSFKWRNYDYAIGRFMSVDPLAEKYTHNGTYNFSENRVIDGVELEGLEVVLLVDKGNYAKADVGHTFVVLGSGKDMTAYTYGRWAGTNENSSGSHSPLNNASGVMVKLEGKEAMQEAQKYVDKYSAQGYEIENVSESLVRTKLEDQFNSSSQTPETGKYKGDERAHVIDNYDLTSNNCTTKSLDAVHKGLGKPIEVKTTTTAGGFPVIQKDSTESTYAPKDLNNQLNQATKDPYSGVKNVTDRFETN